MNRCKIVIVNSILLFRKMRMTSSSEDVILGLKETVRYGLFLGTFAGAFVSVDEIIATLGGHRRHASSINNLLL